MATRQNYDSYLYNAAYDVFAVRHLGFLKDLPAAAVDKYECIRFPLPEIFVGPDRLPISSMDPQAFAAAFALRPMRADETMRVDYPPEQIDVVDHPKCDREWRKLLRLAVLNCFKSRGLRDVCRNSVFELSPRGLTMLGPGASMQFDKIQRERSFGILLVDYPMRYEHGTIHVTREGLTESFDLSRSRGTYISFLHWFHDSTATIEPITSGLRALLLYDIVVNPVVCYPLTLLPHTDRIKYLEGQVQLLVQDKSFRNLHPKTCFLPLVRLLLATYKEESLEVPASCVELYTRVTRSYYAKIQEAINARDEFYDLSDIRREGQELIWSFDGKKQFKRLFGVRYIKELDKLIMKLDPEGGEFL